MKFIHSHLLKMYSYFLSYLVITILLLRLKKNITNFMVLLSKKCFRKYYYWQSYLIIFNINIILLPFKTSFSCSFSGVIVISLLLRNYLFFMKSTWDNYINLRCPRLEANTSLSNIGLMSTGTCFPSGQWTSSDFIDLKNILRFIP